MTRPTFFSLIVLVQLILIALPPVEVVKQHKPKPKPPSSYGNQEYQGPQYQGPQYQGPQYQGPQYQGPQYQGSQYQQEFSNGLDDGGAQGQKLNENAFNGGEYLVEEDEDIKITVPKKKKVPEKSPEVIMIGPPVPQPQPRSANKSPRIQIQLSVDGQRPGPGPGPVSPTQAPPNATPAPTSNCDDEQSVKSLVDGIADSILGEADKLYFSMNPMEAESQGLVWGGGGNPMGPGSVGRRPGQRRIYFVMDPSTENSTSTATRESFPGRVAILELSLIANIFLMGMV